MFQEEDPLDASVSSRANDKIFFKKMYLNKEGIPDVEMFEMWKSLKSRSAFSVFLDEVRGYLCQPDADAVAIYKALRFAKRHLTSILGETQSFFCTACSWDTICDMDTDTSGWKRCANCFEPLEDIPSIEKRESKKTAV